MSQRKKGIYLRVPDRKGIKVKVKEADKLSNESIETTSQDGNFDKTSVKNTRLSAEESSARSDSDEEEEDPERPPYIPGVLYFDSDPEEGLDAAFGKVARKEVSATRLEDTEEAVDMWRA
ncbi:hypothetical protein VTL71DRAFT_9435 [Oculimacula yallundae]|uniref:Uncharacterized protein n=1 Tax=Oculimacula yallundae TaxID=86028 RepID=A0ABR4BS24_9HELO